MRNSNPEEKIICEGDDDGERGDRTVVVVNLQVGEGAGRAFGFELEGVYGGSLNQYTSDLRVWRSFQRVKCTFDPRLTLITTLILWVPFKFQVPASK